MRSLSLSRSPQQTSFQSTRSPLPEHTCPHTSFVAQWATSSNNSIAPLAARPAKSRAQPAEKRPSDKSRPAVDSCSKGPGSTSRITERTGRSPRPLDLLPKRVAERERGSLARKATPVPPANQSPPLNQNRAVKRNRVANRSRAANPNRAGSRNHATRNRRPHPSPPPKARRGERSAANDCC